ncbi:hypothetical protein [Lactobacillus xylocopicola]|uniref:hypothetical protein n=1 Tax=Lactobacillus xylocopicola TaxID=2976676 RepID=UPI002955A970|nr:hypothetical protein [Lactobacillus xylocopicola]
MTIITPILSSTVNASTLNSISGQQSHKVVQSDRVEQTSLTKEIEKLGTKTSGNGITTFEISDAALEKVINKTFGNKVSNTELARKHSAGVTKIKYYGNGNMNVYLSKDMLNRIRGMGYSSGYKIVVGLISAVAGIPTMGVASVLIMAASGSLVSAMLNQVNPFKAGRIYKIRNWSYTGWSYQ